MLKQYILSEINFLIAYLNLNKNYILNKKLLAAPRWKMVSHKNDIVKKKQNRIRINLLIQKIIRGLRINKSH